MGKNVLAKNGNIMGKGNNLYAIEKPSVFEGTITASYNNEYISIPNIPSNPKIVYIVAAASSNSRIRTICYNQDDVASKNQVIIYNSNGYCHGKVLNSLAELQATTPTAERRYVADSSTAVNMAWDNNTLHFRNKTTGNVYGWAGSYKYFILC